jgi:hypothetical protein
MPTWEGGLTPEDFSSTVSPETPRIIHALCQQLGVKTLLVQAHPNLGSRVPTHRIRFQELLIELSRNGVEVFIAPGERPEKIHNLYGKLPKRGVVKIPALESFDCRYALVDVSASEAMAANQRVPSAVLCRPDKPFFAPDSYLQLRASVLLTLKEGAWAHKVDQLGQAEDLAKQETFYDTAVSYSDARLRGMNNAQRFEWLAETLGALPANRGGLLP